MLNKNEIEQLARDIYNDLRNYTSAAFFTDDLYIQESLISNIAIRIGGALNRQYGFNPANNEPQKDCRKCKILEFENEGYKNRIDYLTKALEKAEEKTPDPTDDSQWKCDNGDPIRDMERAFILYTHGEVINLCKLKTRDLEKQLKEAKAEAARCRESQENAIRRMDEMGTETAELKSKPATRDAPIFGADGFFLKIDSEKQIWLSKNLQTWEAIYKII